MTTLWPDLTIWYDDEGRGILQEPTGSHGMYFSRGQEVQLFGIIYVVLNTKRIDSKRRWLQYVTVVEKAKLQARKNPSFEELFERVPAEPAQEWAA